MRVLLAGLEDHPGRLELWVLAGRAIGASGDGAAAVTHWRKALDRFPLETGLRVTLASAQAEAGAFEEALATLRETAATRMLPEGAALELRMLMRLRRWDEAGEIAPLVARIAPANPALMEYHARGLADDIGALLAVCDRVLAARPGHANAIHHRAHVLARLGRAEEARATLALDRFLAVGTLAFDAAFHDRLRAEILANDTLRADPRGKATRSGQQTDVFVRPGDQATVALGAAIREAVQDYARALEGDHGFVRARPAVAKFHPWAVIYNQGGTQAPHRHPSAWLSGVFYVGEGASGALVIGEEADGPYPGGPLRRIAPEAGRLVLFPSYTTHATEAAGGEGQRISVAFDVIGVD